MERKEIVKALGDHFGVKPKYMKVPSCAYQIATAKETYTVDRAGKITTSEGNEVELESIINGRVEEAEVIEPAESTENEIEGFEVALPMEGHTGISLRNLVNMVYSKQALIKKSLGITENIIEDDFCNYINEGKMETQEYFKKAIEGAGEKRCPGITFDFNMNSITFKFFKWEASPEKIKAYTQLAALLNQSAKASKHASFKSKDTDNDKFTFRVWLVKIGMIGGEYKIARKVLIEKLEGNSAFRSGSKPEKVVAENAE
ncbi:MAG: virulence-related protein [Desulfosporosinus sp.]|nr:virulence-related protein [Desulfosporosinus sp.]